MKQLKITTLALIITFFSTSIFAAEKFLLIDILVLQEGKTLKDAEAYFEKVEPIFKKYNFYRSDEVLNVTEVARGQVEAQVVNLWETPDPKFAFGGIFSDKEYEKYIPLRESVFDMKKASVIVTQRH